MEVLQLQVHIQVHLLLQLTERSTGFADAGVQLPVRCAAAQNCAAKVGEVLKLFQQIILNKDFLYCILVRIPPV